MRLTIHLSVSSSEQAQAFLDWYTRHAPVLHYASANHGCSCCEDAFDLEGPEAALCLLPTSWRRDSAWAQGQGESPRVAQVPPRPKLSALSHQARRSR